VRVSPKLWRELRRALLHVLIALVALAAIVRGVAGWMDHGFGFPSRRGLMPGGDDGSFELILMGAPFFFYGIAISTTAFRAARDAAHEDNELDDI
jgi:hypothetical protein